MLRVREVESEAAAAKSQEEMQEGLLGDLVVRQGSIVFELHGLKINHDHIITRVLVTP